MRRTSAMLGVVGLALLVAVGTMVHADDAGADVRAAIQSSALFFEDFDGDWEARWKHSTDAKYTGRFVTAAARNWTDKGLKIPEKSKHYGLTALLAAPVDPVVGPDAPLVVQYEMKYDAGVTCGGAYLKLLSADPGLKAEALQDSTPYSIMFGPDKCGNPGKVHLILRHRNANGSVVEKHLAAPPTPEVSDYTHIYTLRISPDHTFQILINGELKASGDLLAEGVLAPPLVAPKEVVDPEDVKPADWVDLSVMPDPNAVKPADWDERERIEDAAAAKPRGWQDDEPQLINDPAAKRPDGWDDEEDGTWEPNQIHNPKCKVGCGEWRRPMKPNPAYKGAWKAPVIDNPDYKGPWVQKRIPNPDYVEDPSPLTAGVAPIGAVALELWTIDSGYMFDNLLISRDAATAEQALEGLWRPRHEAEVEAFEALMKANAEKDAEKKKAEKEDQKKAARGKKSGKKGGRKGSEQLEAFTERILDLFEDGAVLAPVAPFLAPLLRWLRETPEGSVLIIGVTPLLLLTMLMLWRMTSGTKKAERDASIAVSKKTDAVQPDDDGAAEAEAQEAELPPAAAAAAEPSKAAASKEEIVAAEDDEEAEEEEAGARRRTRRAA